MSFIRVGLRGTLPSGESWSVNPAYNETINVPDWDQEAGQAAATAIGLRSVPTELKSLASVAGRFATVRVERRTDNNVLIGAAEAPWVGGGQPSQSGGKPFQSSVVLSLRSNTPGASGRGRLYWPAIGGSLDPATLRMSNPTTAAVATAAVTFLDGIETDLKTALHPTPSLIDLRLCVYSPTRNTKTDVIRIEVGDVLDVQRRRRDRVAENIAAVSYP